MKKLISVVMCLCLIAGCIPASAFAECSGRTDLQHAIARYDGHVDGIDEGDNYSDYYYSDSYFYGSSYEYNVSLATMSSYAALAGNTSGDLTDWYDPSYTESDPEFWQDVTYNAKLLFLGDPEGKAGFEGIGFTHFAANECMNDVPGKDTCGVMAARKQITDPAGDTYTLIALVIRGDYGSEWASNFTMGREGEHKGFAEARDIALSFLSDYAAALEADESKNIKLWISGYSRGGAITNMMGGALADGYVIDGVSYDLEDVFCYAMEPPMGAYMPEGDYPFIHNVVNINDLVPLLAPACWGFGRYSGDIILPSLVTCGEEEFSSAREAMLRQIDALSLADFEYSIPELTAWYDIDLSLSSLVSGKPHWFITETQVPTYTVLKNGVDFLANDVFIDRDYYCDKYEYCVRQLLGAIMYTDGGLEGFIDYIGGLIGLEAFLTLTAELVSMDNVAYIMAPLYAVPQGSAQSAAGITAVSGLDDSFGAISDRLDEVLERLFAEYAEYEGFFNALKTVFTGIFSQLAKDLAANDTASLSDFIAFVNALLSGVLQAHYPEVNLAWLRSVDPNYSSDVCICPQAQFTDALPVEHWAHDAVDFVLTHGIMSGTSNTAFEPELTVTRAMAVTALYNLDGEPESECDSPFTDVSDEWFAAPVLWAYSVGIAAGMGDGTFAPNEPVTREQLAVMLQNYAAYKGMDITAGLGLDGFDDADSVSDWARGSISWACAVGLISGSDEDGRLLLLPQGGATRAQLAVVLTNYCDL